MKREKKLIIDTILYGISSFGSKFLSFLLIPIYSNYFTKIEFGEWDLILTTMSLITPLISLEIVSALYRWLLESNSTEERISIITTSLIFNLKSIIIFTIGYIVFGYIYRINYYYLIYLMFICSQLDSYILRILRGISKSKEFALIGTVKSILSFLVALICIYIFKMKIETFIYASIYSSLIGIILGVYYSKLWIYFKKNRYSKKLSKEFRKYSFPLIPGAINWWVMNTSDRYIILLFLGLGANGTYAMANKFPALLALINSIFFMAWQDNAIKEFNQSDKNEYYSKIFKYYSRIMFFLLSILIIVNRPILNYVLSSDYSNVWKYSNFLYIANLFSFFSSFWGIGYHGSKNTNIILKTTFIGAIVNFFINIIFIEKIGLYAACISTVLCYIIMWIYRVKSAKDFKIRIKKNEFIIMLILTSLILLVSFLESIYIEIFMLLCIFIIYTVINLKELKEIKRTMIFQKKLSKGERTI